MSGMTKKEKADSIREKATQMRAAREKKEKRAKLLFQGGIAAVLVAAAVAIVLVFNMASTPAISPSNLAGGGITLDENLAAVQSKSVKSVDAVKTTPLAKGQVDIRIYQDYICPGCKAFHEQYGDYVNSLAESGAGHVEYHPIAILDRASMGTKYSTRAAAASICVAGAAPEKWNAFNDILYDNQPGEGTEGLTAAQLIDLAKSADISGAALEEVRTCVLENNYNKWVRDYTNGVTGKPGLPFDNGPLASTPSVIVNGKLLNLSETDFQEYVNKLIGAEAPAAP